ncbi:MAG: KH domain-containing protein [Chloroflexi bacterium]|nr:KH domain-containing protein [Chloroflexota bacterium]
MEQELVEYIAKNLVNAPEQVKVSRRLTSSSVIVELRVAQQDMGRIIGKNGRVANAIRALLRVAAGDQHRDKRVILDID